MAPGDPIPDDHHVSHYLNYRRIDDDGLPASHAFVPRPCKPGLSVNWLEYFREEPDTASRLQRVCRDLHPEIITLKPSGQFAVLNVGDAKQGVLDSESRALRVVYQPESGNLSHTDIGLDGGFTESDERVAMALRSIVRQCHMHAPYIQD